MNYLKLTHLLGIVSSCFCFAKGAYVVLNTTRTIYSVGDSVELTCYVRSNELTVSFRRNNSALGICSSNINGCGTTTYMRDKHGNYELKLEKLRPKLVIKNVTKDDDGADFTCQWTSYSDTVSFAVTDEHVQFEATKTIYKVGDTVTLTCYVTSSWLTVSFARNNSDLGICSTIIHRCASAADIRDKHGNYELKLVKSYPMLVIKNVTRDDAGADFTCQWTSYSDTVSFEVTDENVEFKAASRTYNVGDTVVLTCYVRSSWSTVLLTRNKSDLGHCSTTVNECMSADNMRDGNYELKLEKSRAMLVINNVTKGYDGAEFTCHWTSYTATTSFAVTDIAVATPRMPRDKTFWIIYGIELTSGIAVMIISDIAVATPRMPRDKTFLIIYGIELTSCIAVMIISDIAVATPRMPRDKKFWIIILIGLASGFLHLGYFLVIKKVRTTTN